MVCFVATALVFFEGGGGDDPRLQLKDTKISTDLRLKKNNIPTSFMYVLI